MATDSKKAPPVLGSGGMAASGMIRGYRCEELPVGEFGVPLLPGPPAPEIEPAPEIVPGGETDEREDSPHDPSPPVPSIEPLNEKPVTSPPEEGVQAEAEADGEGVPDAEAVDFAAPDAGDEEPPKTIESASEDLPPVIRGALFRHTPGQVDGPLENAFCRLSDLQLAGLAEGDAATRDGGRAGLLAHRLTGDYRELLRDDRPEAVCIEASETSPAVAMTRAALEAGCHVVTGWPFATSLKEADELLQLARSRNLHFAVVNPYRCGEELLGLAAHAGEVLGEILEIRVTGALDEASGGEDLLFQGGLLFDLARLFTRSPAWCSAHITCRGDRVVAEDVFFRRSGGIGPLLGDRIRAEILFEPGVSMTFLSDERYRDVRPSLCLEICGTRNRARIVAGAPSRVFVWIEDDTSGGPSGSWRSWSDSPGMSPSSPGADLSEGYHAVMDDWANRIGSGAEGSQASAERATDALEIVHAIWQAGLTGKRSYLPLVNRLHPLREGSYS